MWKKLDNLDNLNIIGQNWIIRTKLDNTDNLNKLDKMGQIRQNGTN